MMCITGGCTLLGKGGTLVEPAGEHHPVGCGFAHGGEIVLVCGVELLVVLLVELMISLLGGDLV